MDRALSIPVGIIVARSAVHGPWRASAWRPVSAVLGGSPLAPGSIMRRDEDTAYFFAGEAILNLHATETQSYQTNLEQDIPRLYIVLQPHDNQDDASPPLIHLVTVAPDEAESYLEGDEWLMDGVAMPHALLELVGAFVAGHRVEQPPTHDNPIPAPRPL